MKKYLIYTVEIIFFCLFNCNNINAMMKLSTIRDIYRSYDFMTDYELSRAVHQKYYPDMPFEEFAKLFGGPLTEKDKYKFIWKGEEWFFKKYVNDEYHFSIFYIEDLKIEEKKQRKEFTAFFINEDIPFFIVKITPASEILKEKFLLIEERTLNSDQIYKLLYKKNDFISNCNIIKTYVMNNVAILSSYCYQLNQFDNKSYTYILEMKVLYKDLIYQVRFTTRSYNTIDEAINAGNFLRPYWNESMKSFVLF